ncbi:hypothetical protein J19TS2_15510 [Cohnella xylanilytica]|uniref:ABC transporter permease n=1 Tax=Cohnella xylanilytica TaxID=557555 RepID=UPI001B2AB799|nr:ABC-2 transporter permease [Cohnella xylanilytica]GIO11996.1 hypothetical protein J19TS2_15510 [Cohnella xylanilytica]
MWVKALWSREYEQSRLFFWAVPVVHFLALGFQRMNRWLFTELAVVNVRLQQIGHARIPFQEAYGNGEYETTGRLWLLLAMFVLALVQLGTERKNGSQELLFALPYSRRQIYMHKWLLGAALLTATVVLNTAIDMILVLNSPISGYFSLTYHLAELGYTWLTLLAIYSLVLFVGTITGTVAFQMVLSLVLFILPAGLIMILRSSLEVQGFDVVRPYDGDIGLSAWHDRLIDWLSLTTYLTADYDRLTWLKALVMLLLLAAALTCGMLAYERNRAENNGKLMVFSGWELGLRIGFVVCISMIAGLFVSELVGFSKRIGYDIGLVAGFVLSTLAIRRLTRMRFHL